MTELSAQDRRLATILTYAGILPPWLLLALAQVTDVGGLPLAALGYGAVIASFVAGIQWSTFLHTGGRTPVNLLLVSNAGALAAWAMVLVSVWSMPLGFAGLAAVLGALLYVDERCFAAGVLPAWFRPLRRHATIGLGLGMLAWAVLGSA